MRRLLYVISFTSQIEASKRFYREVLGLETGTDSPYWVDFATDGVGLALLAVNPGTVKGVELCFESEDVERSMTALGQRGVAFTDELRRLAFGSVIHFRDAENNVLSLLQPSPAAAEASPASAGGAAARMPAAAGAETQTSLALEAQSAQRAPSALATGEPRLTSAIVYSHSFPAQRAFYKDRLALPATLDTEDWVRFETGSLSLTLRPRADRPTPHHAAQPVSFGFEVDDLGAWIDIGRDRGLTFLSAPLEDRMGLVVEAVDPEGNVLTFREPGLEQTLEEQLAAPYEDEDAPHQAAIRRPIAKGTRAVSRVALRPEYKPARKATGKPAPKAAVAKKARPEERIKRKPAVAKSRAARPASSRTAGKQARDTRRARPALGRSKKAQTRSATGKKRAVARTSRAKPVKRAARRTRARSKGKR